MCIFCEIAKKSIPSYKIYEDVDCYAFLDLAQAGVGHTLVIPKQHVKNIYELDEATAGKLFEVTCRLAKAISKAMNVEGCNILNNNGSVAGQEVEHFHIHIIPRVANDGNTFAFKGHHLTEEQFKEVKEKITSILKEYN